MSAGTVLRAAVLMLASGLVALTTAWGALALWFRAPRNLVARVPWVVLWSGIGLFTLIALWRAQAVMGLVGFIILFGLLLLWWHRIQPSNARPWADDVAQMTTASFDGDRVTVRQVRNFDWRSATDYTQRWETRSYDMAQVRSVDMIMSYWSRRSIAHMLVSFGFTDGEQLAFSVEIRREKTQAYSEIGGFFKEFELSIIAADERDIVRLRTNVRREDVYLFRLKIPPAARRALLIGYLDEANMLARHPRFYHTITANCTTLVYHMMNRIVGRLPLSYRVLLSGYMPEYVYAVGGFDERYTLEELKQGGRIVDRALKSDRSATFSADIRKDVPGINEAGQ